MDIYLDKENMIVFLSLNDKSTAESRIKLAKMWKESGLPYHIIVLDNINKFELI